MSLNRSSESQVAPLPYWLANHPLTKPTSPNAKDEYWDDTSGNSGTGNGLDSSWTAFGAAQTRAYASGALVLSGTASGGATPNLTGLYKTQPSTPYTVTVRVALSRHTNYNMVQLGFTDSGGTMKLWGLALFQDPVVSTDEYRRTELIINRYASVTSRTSTNTGFIVVLRELWLQVTNDGSNCIARWSPSGTPGSYEVIATESYATALLTPTRFALILDPFSTNTPVGEYGPVKVT